MAVRVLRKQAGELLRGRYYEDSVEIEADYQKTADIRPKSNHCNTFHEALNKVQKSGKEIFDRLTCRKVFVKILSQNVS